MFTRLGLPMNRFTFVLPYKRSLALHLRKCRLRLPDYIVIQSLKDILYDQNFLQRSTRNFEICRQVLSFKKNDEIQKEHTHLSLYLSILRCTLIFPKRCSCTSLSLSLSFSIYICKNGLDPDETRMEFHQFKNVCMR